MKIEELKKAIRNLVRQEVKKIVAEEVSKAMGKVLVEMVKEIKSNNPSPIVEEVENVKEVDTTHNLNEINESQLQTTKEFLDFCKIFNIGGHVTCRCQVCDSSTD